MSWTTPLLTLFVVALFWRTPTERRRDFLFVATLGLVFWLSWQYLPDFGILRLQRSALLRATGGLFLLGGNLALVWFTVWTVARVKAGDIPDPGHGAGVKHLKLELAHGGENRA